MSNEFLAAKLGDTLEHPSVVADFFSGLLKGAIYAAVGIGAAALIGVTGGAALAVGVVAGLAVGFVLGEAIDAIADGFGDLIDDVLGLFGCTTPEATITTGSPNVYTKGKPAARAAGKIDDKVLLAELTAEAQQEKQPEKPKALAIAERALQNAFMLTPVGQIVTAGNLIKGFFTDDDNKAAAKPDDWPDPIKSPEQGFWEGMLSPVVTPKHPYAKPADEDKIICSKWHMFPSDELYLAQGSKSVRINSQPASRNGDKSTCEAKIKHTQSSQTVRIGGPTVTVRDIKSGKNPFASLAGEILGSVFVGLAQNSLRTTLRCLTCALLSETVGTALSSVGGELVSRWLRQAIGSDHPVHLATGAKMLYGDDELDFVLPGHIAIYWQRFYHSRNQQNGVLGQGWTLPFEISLRISNVADNPEQQQLIYTDYSGRELELGMVPLGGNVYFYDEGFRLWRSKQNIFMLETNQGDYQVFEADPLKPNWLRLAQCYDRHDNRLYYRYDQQGLLTHIHDEHHDMLLALHYLQTPLQEQPRLQSVSQCYADQSRLLVSYQYNKRGQLISVSDADQRITRRFAWDDEHNLLIMHQYAAGLQAHYQWQLLTEPAQQDKPAQQHWYVKQHWLDVDGQKQQRLIFDYDLADKQLTLTQEGLGVSVHRWDSLGHPTEYIDVAGRHWQFNWNDASQLLNATDPAGGLYQFCYDERGNICSGIDPLGQKTVIEWDNDFALPLCRIEPDGQVWHYHYNQFGDLLRVTDPLLNETQYRYDNAGNQIEQIDAKGNHYYIKYNQYGQSTEYTDCSGHTTRYSYNDWGVLESITDAQGHSEFYQFNHSGQLLSYTLADSRRYHYHYNEVGLLIKQTDPAGYSTHYDYNCRGQITSQTNAKNHTIHLKYDNFGRLQGLTNEKGEPYQFDYDNCNRLIREFDFSGQKKCYDYNLLDGLIKLSHYPNASALDKLPPIISKFERDAIGRLTAKCTPDYRTEYIYGNSMLQIKRSRNIPWQQNQLQQSLEIIDELCFHYDATGQLTEEQNHGGNYRYHYDETGNLLTTLLPDGEEIRHLYYGGGHLLQSDIVINDQRIRLAEYQRDSLHREIARSQGILTQHTHYDVTGRITGKSSRITDSNHVIVPVINKIFGYDAQNNLTKISREYGGTAKAFQYGPQITEFIHYDPLGHISSLQVYKGEKTSFAYDEAGNWLPTGTTDKDTLHNRLSHYNGWQCEYDGFGRLAKRCHDKTKQQQIFNYNSEHQLTSVQFKHHADYERVEYHYDALGRRTAKTCYPLNPETLPETITFHWQGLQMCAETSNRKTTDKILYLYNPGSYDPIARIDCNTKTNQQQIYYFHSQLNGLPEELTDENGRIVWQGNYQLWGKLNQYKPSYYPNNSNPHRLEQNLRFAGQYADNETGLHYNTFRYYDPESGHFTQQDPIGLMGGINLYSYAPNPLGWVDPLGLCVSAEIQAKKLVKEFDIVPYRPSNPPLENHHGVLDVWMAILVPGYGGKYPKGSPTIALSREAHAETKAVFRKWLKEKTGKPVGGKVDWSTVSNKEMQQLAERMFDAAKVPIASRNAYYRALNQYLYTGVFDSVIF